MMAARSLVAVEDELDVEELELVDALPGEESFSFENLSLSSSSCWGSCVDV
jgi:hypothetical protein